jgi:hypothetical protein
MSIWPLRFIFANGENHSDTPKANFSDAGGDSKKPNKLEGTLQQTDTHIEQAPPLRNVQSPEKSAEIHPFLTGAIQVVSLRIS